MIEISKKDDSKQCATQENLIEKKTRRKNHDYDYFLIEHFANN